MAISQEQRSFRAGRIGSSDAVRIMDGRWREVWGEKTGRIEPPDLDFVPAVQIGVATEHLHARFYTNKTGIACCPAGERTYVHPRHDFVVAHLDFLTWEAPHSGPEQPADTVLEAKFHAGFKSDEELAERYYWQLQHQMEVGGFDRAVLSVLRPSGYSFLPVCRSDADAARLLETLRAFWWHVENDVEPLDPPQAEAPAFDRLRVLDMGGHNEFVSLSGVLVESRSGFTSYREAETALKALMPDEARIAYVPPAGADGQGGAACRGVVLTRSRDGRLSLKFGDLPRKYRGRTERWRPDLAFPDVDDMELP
ncbi:MAG TPA: YqaJ viral recombinase family protein [Alphaproteobacteria bacterium]|nr:YqaJ viral recombinase family protein [Alphaproteobacteria bacterium]